MSKRVLIAIGVAVVALVAAFIFYRADLLTDPEPRPEPEQEPEQEPEGTVHLVTDHGEGKEPAGEGA